METKAGNKAAHGQVATVEYTENLLYAEDGTVRKLPIPSNDPNDPLNFGPWRQRLIMIAICVYGIAGFGVVQSTPLFFGELVPEYMKQTRGVSSLTCISPQEATLQIEIRGL